jgi:predicted ABC-type sugar transport system permease subunit
MIDPFALISGVALLGASAFIAFRVRQLVPAALAIVLLAVIAALAAVRFGLFDSLTPLLVIYANSALMGGIGGALYARKRAEEGGH